MDRENPAIDALREVIDEVRSLFHLLRRAAERVHGEGARSAPRRGVLLSLLREGPRTVPQLASERFVSRQHVQVVVNGLLEDGLAELRSNPAHRRSHLVALTSGGRKRIEAMLVSEGEALARLDLEAGEEELRRVAGTLAGLRKAFLELALED